MAYLDHGIVHLIGRAVILFGKRETTLFLKARDVILQDAVRRDLTTARRIALFEILWHERYLTRRQLIARVELRLGRNCFATFAGEHTFYRDMRVVKEAFQAAKYELEYSRRKDQPGYYLRGQSALSDELRQLVRSAAAEVDQRQIDIYKKLPPAVLFRQGCGISDAARNVVAYRLRQENPGMSEEESIRITLQEAYRR